MRRLLYLFGFLLAAALSLPAAADRLDGVVPLAKDDFAAVAQIKATPERHILLYFGELEMDDDDSRHAMVKRHNPRKPRPVLVFLDGQGKEVARLTGGLKSADDALLLDRFVTEKHYRKSDFSAFKAAQRG